MLLGGDVEEESRACHVGPLRVRYLRALGQGHVGGTRGARFVAVWMVTEMAATLSTQGKDAQEEFV